MERGDLAYRQKREGKSVKTRGGLDRLGILQLNILDVCLRELLPAHLELSVSRLLLLLERDCRVVVEQEGDFLEREALGPETECTSVFAEQRKLYGRGYALDKVEVDHHVEEDERSDEYEVELAPVRGLALAQGFVA